MVAVSHLFIRDNAAREAICVVGKSLFDRGYVHATAGNISVRLDDGYLITPTDACLGMLDPAELSKVDFQGNPISGAKPSKTIALHRAVYEATRAFAEPPACVLHTHSTHLVAMTLQAPAVTLPDDSREILPAITPYFVMKVGHVPWINYESPGAPEAIAQTVRTIEAYRRRDIELRAVMMERLGPNVWHKSPQQAMALLEELEETAKLWTLSNPKPSPLTGEQIDSLRQRFGARW